VNSRWFVIFLVLLLTACTQMTVDPAPVAKTPGSLWQQRQKQLTTFIDWDLKGRLAVRAGTRTDMASFNWKRNSTEQEIQLFGPFGGGRVRISENLDRAILTDGMGREVQGRSAEEVLFNALAWSVPFKEMGYWVRGLPAPGKHDGIGFDYGGRARHLTQRGWRIEYPEYRTFQGVELPNRIVIRALPGTVTLDRGDPIPDPISVKLVIGSWNGEPKAG
jgi:outer membrane lipoprotein LolB